MTMTSGGRGGRGVPRVPTLPTGELVAAYGTYLEAQKAVDHLADKDFPVQNVTIVGTDLRMVERVTGRLTYGRVALAGGLSGAWFGLFVGLLLSIFSTEALFPILPAMAIGAAFGILFSVISYSFTGGRRDFTSASQIVAPARTRCSARRTSRTGRGGSSPRSAACGCRASGERGESCRRPAHRAARLVGRRRPRRPVGLSSRPRRRRSPEPSTTPLALRVINVISL